MTENNLLIQNEALEPVQKTERIVALDVLRGFAIFGVLIAYTMWSLGNPPEETYSLADKLLNLVVATFVDTKAYTLLATLFGLGFSIQMIRAKERGVNFKAFYCRRLVALALIGLAHALLLRNGDVLVPYAAMGFVLLIFRNASNKTLLVVALAGLVCSYFAQNIWGLTGFPYPKRPKTEGMDHFASNFAFVRYWYSTALVIWTPALPLFVFGLYLGRIKFFENISAHRKALKRISIIGFVAGILAMVGIMILGANEPPFFGQRVVSQLLWTLHGWLLAAFYASTLVLLLQKQFFQKLFMPFEAVGRMALTNYLLQATIIVPICIIFDLFDKVSPVIGILLALGVWMVQVPLSIWWLKNFQFGPAEWLWRSLTYGRLQSEQTSKSNRILVRL